MALAKDASGNTKALGKAKHFQLTLNEPEKYEELKKYITGLKTNNYFISVKEKAPTTGHEHIHIYAQFSNTISLSIKKTCGAHIVRCNGTPQQNIDYFKKGGEILDEIGVCRKWGGLPTIAEAKEATNEELEQLPLNYYNIVEKIKSKKQGEKYYKEPNFEWHYGPTGTGKTRAAFEAGAENVIYNNGFFSDWGDARVISIEEMRGQIPWDELLRLTDGYHNYYKVNIKGGSKYVDLDGIFITSPKRPEQCYPNKAEDDSIKQLLRRITKIVEHKLEGTDAGDDAMNNM